MNLIEKLTTDELLAQIDTARSELESAIEDFNELIASEWPSVEEAANAYDEAVAKAREAGADAERELYDVRVEKPEVQIAFASEDDAEDNDEGEWDEGE